MFRGNVEMPVQIFIDSRLTWISGINSKRYAAKGCADGMLLEYDLNRRTSVKDLIESLGIPHTEIGWLKINDVSAGFESIPVSGDIIWVFGHDIPIDFSKNPLLRPALRFEDYSFAVDANVGRLARLLRMLGLNVFYENGLSDEALADLAHEERRILLTKDIRLLMRKKILYGHLVKEIYADKQLFEIVKVFGLKQRLRPFSRCIMCNGVLMPVEKNAILDRLEPLTKIFYDRFHICPHCQRIYWNGSHKARMEKLIAALK